MRGMFLKFCGCQLQIKSAAVFKSDILVKERPRELKVNHL